MRIRTDVRRIFVLALLTNGAEAWIHPLSLRQRHATPRTALKTLLQQQQQLPYPWTSTTSSSSSSSAALEIYSLPALYDLAFGYRDYVQEVDFLMKAHVTLTHSLPRRIVELAAGPARHALSVLQKYDNVLDVTCVDFSPAMAKYSLDLADQELNASRREAFHYVVTDMRNVRLDEQQYSTIDTVWMLLGSLQHLTTNQDVIECFRSVWDLLVPGGTFILELPHPREVFGMIDCTRNGWQVPLDDDLGGESGFLDIIWGDEDDEFDPVTQIRQFTIAMELKGSDASASSLQSVKEVVPLRLFTAQEIELFATCSGLRVTSMHGALEEGVDVNDEDVAFRLVCVLQKV